MNLYVTNNFIKKQNKNCVYTEKQNSTMELFFQPVKGMALQTYKEQILYTQI